MSKYFPSIFIFIVLEKQIHKKEFFFFCYLNWSMSIFLLLSLLLSVVDQFIPLLQ